MPRETTFSIWGLCQWPASAMRQVTKRSLEAWLAQLHDSRPDCRAAYEALLERGAEFLTPPRQQGREVRCFFRDPDGHRFEISEYG